MDLTGTAGRQMLGRLSAKRERKDRAAANDNRCPVSCAPGGEARGETIGCGKGDTSTPPASHQRGVAHDTRQHVGGLD